MPAGSAGCRQSEGPDLRLACELVDRTRVSRLLKGYPNVPPADRRALELMLVKVAQLVAELPEVRELDLNPVLADENGVIAVDAHEPDRHGLRMGMGKHPWPAPTASDS